MIVIIKQTIEIPHPMYVTIESAVDSAAGTCRHRNNDGHVSLVWIVSSKISPHYYKNVKMVISDIR